MEHNIRKHWKFAKFGVEFKSRVSLIIFDIWAEFAILCHGPIHHIWKDALDGVSLCHKRCLISHVYAIVCKYALYVSRTCIVHTHTVNGRIATRLVFHKHTYTQVSTHSFCIYKKTVEITHRWDSHNYCSFILSVL